MSKIAELFGVSTSARGRSDWASLASDQRCPFIGRKCLKTRKSQPDVAIGSCTVRYGARAREIVICPFRFLERRQVFTDCLHLLTLHEPGNEIHVVPEVTIPGGSVDYCLVSATNRRVVDFAGIEFQTLDTTGTVWPERQRFLHSMGVSVPQEEVQSGKAFGMNWKMTAKTVLVQLHHKVETFESINRHVVLVVQDHLLAYMRSEFSFGHLRAARVGDPMHIHAYGLRAAGVDYGLTLGERASTDSAGIARCLGLQASPKVDFQRIVDILEAKLSDATLLTV